MAVIMDTPRERLRDIVDMDLMDQTYGFAASGHAKLERDKCIELT